MALARYEGVAQDSAGNVIPNASVEVRRDQAGRPVVPLFSDRNGSVPMGNPITTNERGQFAFHVPGGVYYIRVFTGPSQAPFQEYTRRYQAVGTAAERDIEDLASTLEAGMAGFSTVGELQAFTPNSTEGVLGKVQTGPGAGFYHFDDTKPSGSKWVFDRPLYDTFARLLVVGGAANSIEAELEDGLEDAVVKLMALIPSQANTGPVLLNGRPLRDVSGAALVAGQLIPGRSYNLTDEGDHYRLRQESDITGVPAGIAAAAEAAINQIEPLLEETGALRDQSISAASAAGAALSLTEAARDSSFANAKGDTTIALARARVSDNETFIVYEPGALMFTAYRRLSSTTETKLGEYPASRRIDNVQSDVSTLTDDAVRNSDLRLPIIDIGQGWAEAEVDSEGNVLAGTRGKASGAPGQKYIADLDYDKSSGPGNVSTFSGILNNWAEAEVDAAGRVISGTKTDGTKYLAKLEVDSFQMRPTTVSSAWTLLAAGDSMTEGNQDGSGVTYPAELAMMLGRPVTNVGKSGWTSTEVAIRLGAVDPTLNAVTLPAAAGEQAVVAVSSPTASFRAVGSTSMPFWDGSVLSAAGAILASGVRFRWQTHESQPHVGSFTVERITNGDAVNVPAGSKFHCTEYDNRLGDLLLLDAGRNNIGSLSVIMRDHAAILGHLTPSIKRVVVCGPVNAPTETTGSSGFNNMQAAISAESEFWGAAFIDTWSELRAGGLDWNGLTATPDDLADIAAGLIPRQLLAADRFHLNRYGYKYKAELVFRKLTSLDWRR